jgi:hypothetical protein
MNGRRAPVAFYTNVLGFTKVFENGDPVGFMILKRNDAELHYPATAPQGGGLQYCPSDGG